MSRNWISSKLGIKVLNYIFVHLCESLFASDLSKKMLRFRDFFFYDCQLKTFTSRWCSRKPRPNKHWIGPRQNWTLLLHSFRHCKTRTARLTRNSPASSRPSTSEIFLSLHSTSASRSTCRLASQSLQSRLSVIRFAIASSARRQLVGIRYLKLKLHMDIVIHGLCIRGLRLNEIADNK